MPATVGSCDRFFGSRHVQTVSLAARIAEVFRDLSDAQTARTLFDRVVRDFRQDLRRAGCSSRALLMLHPSHAV